MAEYPLEDGGTAGGGIGTYGGILIPALAERGHEVHVLSCVLGQKNQDQVSEGVHIHRRGQLGLKGILGIFKRSLANSQGSETGQPVYVPRRFPPPKTVHRLRSALSTYLSYQRLRISFDVIEYPDWGAEGLLFSLMPARPLVARLHTPLAMDYEHSSSQPPKGWDVKMASAAERIAVNRADSVIAGSAYMAEETRKMGWLKNSSVTVIPLPVDAQRWQVGAEVSQTERLVLFIGRLDSLKAPEILVDAIAILRKEMPDVRADFVGSSTGIREGIPYINWLKERRSGTDGCEFSGPLPRTEIPYKIDLARVVALPSRHESFSLVAAEAMSAGRPVVLTSSVGLADSVAGAKAGEVVPPGDPEALADALRPYLEDSSLALRTGVNGRALVRNMLDADVVAEQHEQLYGELVGRSGGRTRRWFTKLFGR